MEQKVGVEYMNEKFFAERLSALREAKGVSAREMSLAIGQSANYINKIENRKAYPSMEAFYYICEYLGVSPKDFFDEGNVNPNQLNEIISDMKKLDEKSLSHIAGIVKELGNKKK